MTAGEQRMAAFEQGLTAFEQRLTPGCPMHGFTVMCSVQRTNKSNGSPETAQSTALCPGTK